MDYYNEIDPYASQWLRNLIAAGHIPAGVVDERSIEDVRPAELMGFRRCHFFAGIGVWALALVNANWPDHRRVWTGSCPCQPFSAAGKGDGFDDKRHLWPHWRFLIEQCRPTDVLGEQVASKDAGPWIDLVQDDMEATDYAFGAVAFPAAGVKAPHIRDRIYWVAKSEHSGRETRESSWYGASATVSSGPSRRMGDADEGRSRRHPGAIFGTQDGAQRCVRGFVDGVEPAGSTRRLANSNNRGQRSDSGLRLQRAKADDADGRGPLGGFWSDAEWLPCRDGKWRPVEPSTFPLAHGASARVGRLRAYGNAIVEPQAREFITAYLESGY